MGLTAAVPGSPDTLRSGRVAIEQVQPVLFEHELSPRLRAVLERESTRLGAIAQRILEKVLKSVPEYATANDPHVQTEMLASLVVGTRQWFESLLHRRSLSPAVLREAIDLVSGRLYQGISLPSILRSIRIAETTYWSVMVEAVRGDTELQTELLLFVGPYSNEHFETITDVISRSYLAEQTKHVRWRDRLRAELFSVLINRPDDTHAFHASTMALGIDPNGDFCAVVLRPAACHAEWPEYLVDGPLARLARKLGIASATQMMYRAHHDHLVAWIEMPKELTPVQFDQSLARTVEGSIGSEKSIEAIAIGLAGSSAHGWRTSMEQCFRALDAHEGSNRTGKLRRFSSVMLDDAILTSQNASKYIASMLETLSRESALLHTLEAYIEHKQHRKATAAALEIHPNSLDHRLERIETLLDGRFDDVDWLARLRIALRLYRPARNEAI